MPFMFIALALASIAFWRMTLDTNGQLIEGTAYPQNWVDVRRRLARRVTQS